MVGDWGLNYNIVHVCNLHKLNRIKTLVLLYTPGIIVYYDVMVLNSYVYNNYCTIGTWGPAVHSGN